MSYQFIRPILFAFEPETSHKITFKLLKILNTLRLLPTTQLSEKPKTVMGLKFPNPIGLAAGLDKNGEYIDILAKFGFGFIEIGSVTPRAQTGNPKPRLFRLTSEQALINRLGLNNIGVDAVIENIKKAKYKGVLGISITQNNNTPEDKMIDDYVYCLRQAYLYASYISIDISCPNVKNPLLANNGLVESLLKRLKTEQENLKNLYQRYVPLVPKISPDLSTAECEILCNILLSTKIDGVIATNTTKTRPESIKKSQYATEKGGLSGEPLFTKTLSVVKELKHHLKNHIPIIGCGGIVDAEKAKQIYAAGAELIQVYTGFIYHGSGLLREIDTVST